MYMYMAIHKLTKHVHNNTVPLLIPPHFLKGIAMSPKVVYTRPLLSLKQFSSFQKFFVQLSLSKQFFLAPTFSKKCLNYYHHIKHSITLMMKLKYWQQYCSCWWNEVRPWNGCVLGPLKMSLSPDTAFGPMSLAWRTERVCDSKFCIKKPIKSWTSPKMPYMAALLRLLVSLVFIHFAACICISSAVGAHMPSLDSLLPPSLKSLSLPSSSFTSWILTLSTRLCFKQWFWYVLKFLKVLEQRGKEHWMLKSGSWEWTLTHINMS